MSIREEDDEKSDLPHTLSHQQIHNDRDEIWNIIIARLPNTALILREMEKVINTTQNLFNNFQINAYSHSIDDNNKLQSSVINDNDTVSIQCIETSNSNKKQIINKSIQADECNTTVIDHSSNIDRVEVWNQFNGKNLMAISCSSSSVTTYHSPSSSTSSSSCIFLNAKSSSTFDQIDDDKLKYNDPLYEIGKVNAINYDSVIKNYESTISITKQAHEIIKNVESTGPTITIKDVMLAPIKPRVCQYANESSIINNNLHELTIDAKQQTAIQPQQQILRSSTLRKPSSIPRRISNKSHEMYYKK